MQTMLVFPKKKRSEIKDQSTHLVSHRGWSLVAGEHRAHVVRHLQQESGSD